MLVYCNFLLLTSQEKLFEPPHFFWAGCFIFDMTDNFLHCAKALNSFHFLIYSLKVSKNRILVSPFI